MSESSEVGAARAQFALNALVWGSSFLFIKVALRGMAPVQVATGRVLCGAAALGVFAVLRRRPLPRRPAAYLHLLVVALLLCSVPFTLFAVGETRIDSGLASILNATTPLLTLFFATLFLPSERPTTAKVAGLLLGFAGVLTVLGPWRGVGTSDLLGELACLGATSCYGVAFIWFRRYVVPLGLDAVTVAFVQVSLAAVVLLAATPFLPQHAVHLDLAITASMLALGVLGTGLAYVFNSNVIRVLGATAASTVTYLTPVVGVLLGVLLLGERVTWNEPVGGLVVILGIALGQGLLSPSRLAVRPG